MASALLFLFQVDAAQAVVGLGARRIIAEGEPEVGLGLIEVAALEKSRAEREIVSSEFVRRGIAGEGKRFGQALGRGVWNLPDVSCDLLLG